MASQRGNRPLLIVDGDNLTHRAYHSTPKTVLGKAGEPVNAIVGFFSMIAGIWQREGPRAIYVAWDTLGVDTYRSKLWPSYQEGRVFEQFLIDQLNRLPDLCRAFGFGVGKQHGYEADDFMASATKAELRRGGMCLLLTTDRDSYQLVSDRVTVLSARRGARELDRIGPHEVVERFGVLPEQVPDFKALCGDASDRIPGAKGIGPKGAAALLLKHGTLDNVLKSWPNRAEADMIRLFREVVMMDSAAQVTLPSAPPDWKSGAEVLRSIGVERLADRLASLLDSST